MQAIHLSIALTSFFLIFKYAPFKLIEKVFLASGYFFLFEYCVISRNYAIAVLFIILICISLKRSPRRTILDGFLLLALCNTNLYGALIAAMFSFHILLSMMEKRNDRVYLLQSIIPLGFTAIGFLLLYFQIKPATLVQYNEYYKWKGGFNTDHVLETVAKLFDVYFPIPSLNVADSFGKNVIEDFLFLKTVIVIAALAFISVGLKKNKSLLSMYLAGTAGILGVLYFNEHTSLRHEGFLFILLVIVMWLFRNEDNPDRTLEKRASKIFLFILAVQSLGGLIAISKDIAFPFSNLYDAGQFAMKQGYDRTDISGIPDYVVSPLTAFIHKPVYVTETGNQIKFVSWNDERKEDNEALSALFARADSIIRSGKLKTIIVMNQALIDTMHQLLFNVPVTDSMQLTLVKRFDKPSMIGDEKYYFYEMTKRN